MADPNTVQDVTSVLASVNQLKDSAMWFLGVLAVLGLIGFWMWLKYSKATEAKKDARAKLFRDSQDKNTKMLSEMSQHISLQTSLLRRLADAHSGLMNTEDSLRIIEEQFDKTIIPEFRRIAEGSLVANHYSEDPKRVQLKTCEKLSKVIYAVQKDLSRFSMVLQVNVFFQGDGEEYDITKAAWQAIKQTHLDKATKLANKDAEVGTDFITNDFAEHVKVMVTREIHRFFNAGKIRALDMYYQDNNTEVTRKYGAQPQAA